jgi:uncharacterized membrane protein YhaH (DUF805 family)
MPHPDAGIGLFSGIFALLSLIPAIIVHIKRFHYDWPLGRR